MRKGHSLTPVPFFVIFSRSRCGSTTLHRALSLHKDIRCQHEPHFGGSVRTREALWKKVEEIRRNHNGIKHVWDPNGWPFDLEYSRMDSQVPEWMALNEALLTYPNQRVIFLRRRNLLRRIVSDLMGSQVDLFSPAGDAPATPHEGEKYRRELRTRVLAPIEAWKIEKNLATERDLADRLRTAVDRAGTECLDLEYEAFLEQPTTSAERRRNFDTVLAFLGREPIIDAERLEQLDVLLDPAHQRQNNADTYRQVPNIDEIELRFGNDETGWLFRNQAQNKAPN